MDLPDLLDVLGAGGLDVGIAVELGRVGPQPGDGAAHRALHPQARHAQARGVQRSPGRLAARLRARVPLDADPLSLALGARLLEVRRGLVGLEQSSVTGKAVGMRAPSGA